MNRLQMFAKRIAAIFFLTAPLAVLGQSYHSQFLNLAADPEYAPHRYLQLGSQYNLNANSLNNNLFNAFLYSDSISGSAKSSPLSHLKPDNDFGGYLYNTLYYSWQPGTRAKYYYINVSSRISYSSKFNPDLYKLVFFGNEQFAGKPALLSGFSFHHFAYQSLQFGTYRYLQNNNNRNILVGGGISLVLGAGYSNISIPRGELFTSASGDSVAIDARMSSQFVNASNNITDVNGLGLSVNAFCALQLSDKDELRFQVEDLGLVDWFQHNTSFSFDQKLSYTGENVNAANGQFTVSSYHLFFDSLAQSFVSGTGTGGFTSVLPFQVRLLYTHAVSRSLSLSGCVEYVNDNMPLPDVNLSALQALAHDKLKIRLGVSGFGYGTYGISAGLQYAITKKIGIEIGTQHFEGVVPVQNTNGQSFYGNMGLKF